MKTHFNILLKACNLAYKTYREGGGYIIMKENLKLLKPSGQIDIQKCSYFESYLILVETFLCEEELCVGFLSTFLLEILSENCFC